MCAYRHRKHNHFLVKKARRLNFLVFKVNNQKKICHFSRLRKMTIFFVRKISKHQHFFVLPGTNFFWIVFV